MGKFKLSIPRWAVVWYRVLKDHKEILLHKKATKSHPITFYADNIKENTLNLLYDNDNIPIESTNSVSK